MMENLEKLNDRLGKITPEEISSKEVNAEHALTAIDLLSVIESSIGDRFDERVLFALNERRVDRLEKRNEQKEQLEDLTIQLKVFSVVQSKYTRPKVLMALTSRVTQRITLKPAILATTMMRRLRLLLNTNT